MPSAAKEETTAPRQASITLSSDGSPMARRTMWRASVAIRTRSASSSRSSASRTELRATSA